MADVYTRDSFAGFRSGNDALEHVKRHGDEIEAATGIDYPDDPIAARNPYTRDAVSLMTRRDDDVVVLWQRAKDNLAVYDPERNLFVAGGRSGDEVQTFFKAELKSSSKWEDYVDKIQDTRGAIVISGNP